MCKDAHTYTRTRIEMEWIAYDVQTQIRVIIYIIICQFLRNEAVHSYTLDLYRHVIDRQAVKQPDK